MPVVSSMDITDRKAITLTGQPADQTGRRAYACRVTADESGSPVSCKNRLSGRERRERQIIHGRINFFVKGLDNRGIV